jgi:hypothetical protein
MLSKATAGAVPVGLKDFPAMVICLVELLTTVLKITGVVAPQPGRARNMDKTSNDVMRACLSTLGILFV